MRALIEFVVEKPKRTVVIVLLATLLFMAFASQLKEETSLNAMFPNYPEAKLMTDIQHDFGNAEPVVIILQGDNVLTPEYFSRVAEITSRLLNSDSISDALIHPKEQSIESLPEILALYRLSLEGNMHPSQSMILEEMRSFKSQEEITGTFRAFLSDPNVPRDMKDYALSFLPKDFNDDTMKSGEMGVYVSLNAGLPESKLERVEREIETVARGVDASSLTYGFQLLNYYYVKTEERLVPAFVLALILILALMFFNFRNISDVILSLLALFLAMIWTFGLAGALGWKFDLMAGMVPILILGLGIDFSFHVLMGYREKLRETGTSRKAMKVVLSTVGVALLLAMITTVVGFSSNGISDLPSMRHFGFLSAFSILSVFVLNITFVPAIRVLIDGRREKGTVPAKKARGEHRTLRVPWFINGKIIAAVLFLAILLVGAAGWYLGLGMKASYDPTGELARDLSVTRAYDLLNEKFSVGTERVYIRVDGDLTNPALWDELQDAVRRMNDDKYVVGSNGTAKVEWILTLVPFLSMENPEVLKTYAAVDRNGDGFIGGDASPEELKDFLSAVYSTPMGRYYLHRNKNGGFNGLLLVVPTRTDFGYHGKELLKELRDDFGGVTANVSFTGEPIIWAKGLDDVRDSMLNSMFLCLLFAFIVLPLAFGLAHRSPLLGLLVAVAPFLVLGWLFLTMRLLNIPLNTMTAMVGAIIVGIGIDYPIHIANRWALERRAGRNFSECYSISLSSTGREVLYSALTTLIAFGVLVTIPIPIITQFATTTLFGLIYSFLGAVLVLPILIRLFWHGGTEEHGHENRSPGAEA
ncbi:efflux RND transporter permease subunit [Thermococcus aciditolerans]|uniref:MMPL family transporter n=1 Tax=Thermococcus aciditolerans TaxID=2598455 RepID=A0A5C0SPR3_9EURY|nr:MMPL family transporter [Thermococcus aciditolerans]QEK15434.1 MMPL family transporter [Thermococcus aciditolerans]